MTDGVKLTLFDSWIDLVTLIDRKKTRIRRWMGTNTPIPSNSTDCKLVLTKS